MPVVYEVNLSIDADMQSAFREWLRGQIREMLELPGFKEAKLFETEPGSAGASTVQYVVQFVLVSREALQEYFQTQASRMRQKGVDRFGDHLISHRRILLPL